jgi:diadenosine tetraphosphate (Ap4A) HIT family hydrolase
MACAFCSLRPERIVRATDSGMVIRDAYPVSPGHTLIVPKRHVPSFFDATPVEKVELLNLLEWAKEELLSKHRPDGFNIGVNDGLAAGQTVMHLHIHLIPRYSGDSADPRGGVRWIFPERADYWSKR